MKVLFAASEASPFIRTGGLGDVMGALPAALKKKGVETAVVLPLYSDMKAEYRNSLKYIGNTTVFLGWRSQYAGVFMSRVNDVDYYFIDNEYYFKRNGIYGHFDDGERFAFFSKAVLETMQVTGFYPDILQCNDWQTGLSPLYLDCFYRFVDGYKTMKTVMTIHNIEFQGRMDKYVISNVFGVPSGMESIVEYKGDANMMKAGIESANKVVTVSPTYAGEILEPYFAYGLESILNARSYKLSGIVNGIDTDLYNPKTDKALFVNFDYKSFAKKAENKHGLQELLGLPASDRPLIGMVTRLTPQKGIDLILNVIREMLSMDIQFVVLGTGDAKYENALREIAKQFPTKLATAIYFSADIASKIYGGSDMFLMPSKYEPCGLSQMIAMRYGSIPIVRETGGLKDTVPAFDPTTKQGLGFTFKTYNAHDMLGAVQRAVDTFYQPDLWAKGVVKNAMAADFSWDKSADDYLRLYNNI